MIQTSREEFKLAKTKKEKKLTQKQDFLFKK